MKNSPHETGYSLDDLNQLALEADMYVNEPARLKQRKRRLGEVIPMLDDMARNYYIDQPVRVFGIHARSEYKKDTNTIHQYMSPGQVTGISEGFSAIDFDDLSMHFSQGGDERHLRLIRELRERSVGSIGIGHLVRRSIVTSNIPNFLMSAHYINRAIAPVATSVLYPEIHESSVLGNDERLVELLRILCVSRRQETIEAFGKIQDAVTNAPDPLVGLANCAEHFSELCARGDPNLVTAAHDYLNIVAGPRLFGKVYSFPESMPPSLVRPQEGGTHILQFPTGDEHSFLFTNLAIANNLEQSNNVIKMNDEAALYAVTHLYEDGAVDPSLIFIPIGGLKDRAFKVLGQAVNNLDEESV
jgi:hypothetical protein